MYSMIGVEQNKKMSLQSHLLVFLACCSMKNQDTTQLLSVYSNSNSKLLLFSHCRKEGNKTMCCRISDQLHPILDRVCVTLQDWVNNYSIMHRILSGILYQKNCTYVPNRIKRVLYGTTLCNKFFGEIQKYEKSKRRKGLSLVYSGWSSKCRQQLKIWSGPSDINSFD